MSLSLYNMGLSTVLVVTGAESAPKTASVPVSLSLYKVGLSTALVVTGAESAPKTASVPQEGEPSKPSMWFYGALATGIAGIVWWSKRKPDNRGPDVSDLEARYRARGIDPRKVFG